MRYNKTLLGTSLLALSLTPVLAHADVPRVVTEFGVTQSLVAMVMGDLGAPDVLLDAGADAHHFQLRPSHARALAQAGLVVWVSHELTPWIERAVEGLADGARLELIDVAGTRLQPYEDHQIEAETETEAAHGHGHGHSHGHSHGHDHAQAPGHDDHDEMDPHAWLDPDNAAIWLGAIAETLAAQDPANAGTYHANARAAAQGLAALDDEIRATLAPVGDAGLVMYHDAYGYFASRYGLNILGTIALGSAADPGAQSLARLRATLDDAGAVCIFPEVQHPDAYVTLVSEGTAVRIGAPLDPEGSLLPPGADLYPALMRGLAQAIAACVAG
jgi:zinc transport system substrate-binding protein